MVAGRKPTRCPPFIALGSLGLALVARPSVASPWAEPRELPLGDGSFVLSVRAGTGARSWGQAENLALVELVVPLERLAAPRAGLAEAASGEPSDSAPERPHQPTGRARGATPSPVAELDLARRAVRAALSAAGYGASARRLDSLSARARSSATLPEVRLRAARTSDESLRLSPTTADPYRYTQAGGTSLWFEARLTWRLDRLVFAKEELAVERLRSERAHARAALVQKVLTLVIAWRRATRRSLAPELLPEEREQAAVDAADAALALDLLTGGWFAGVLAGPASAPSGG
ncbi:MAG: hypothetical protein OZ921_02935 [Sorangiineae bacterium]|nr:hypothetical protein [Polyangiaceae bacterium]MEB2321443.1 hypothetical protein [Sorangiineae bacterium]